MARPRAPEPRTFYLNEHHELVHDKLDPHATPRKLAPVDWNRRAARLSDSLTTTRAAVKRSKDPLREQRYFLVAVPEDVQKESTAKGKPPVYVEKTRFGAEDSLVLGRLGLDLIAVNKDGRATVHATHDRFDRLLATSSRLATQGPREQARWIAIESFEEIPAHYRVDPGWLATLPDEGTTEAIVELQPLLSRAEAGSVASVVATWLDPRRKEALTAAGTDFSGRYWYRGQLSRGTIERLARELYSIQSIHAPLYAVVSARPRSAATRTLPSGPRAAASNQAGLPTIAIVDTGIPEGHPVLGMLRRGQYRHPDAAAPYFGDHGSRVASRAVFGDLDLSAGLVPLPPPSCQVLDVMIATDHRRIEEKAVLPALEAIVATYPDVRVFNLSFGDERPLASYDPVELRARLSMVADLDNFVFARDALVVIAAGNSPPDIQPLKRYPDHIEEAGWALAAWPSGFNTLTCGSTVETLHPEGLVTHVGWPSPFTRIGPGIAQAPVPEFADHGGNTAQNWQWRPSFGVWGCCADGSWQDYSGTSQAAPLLAREVAFVLRGLEGVCSGATRPFSATVKAFLVATATYPPGLPRAVNALAQRTIGHGRASSRRLAQPAPDSALFLWQGVLESPEDIARVQLPVPRAWLAEAQAPRLRIVCSWHPPVNDASPEVWASRRVTATVHASDAVPALRGTGRGHPSYPQIDRTYDLRKPEDVPMEDAWLLKLRYEQKAAYHVGIQFSPQQRVAIAAVLWDESDSPVSPQQAVQMLPAAATMLRLSSLSTPLMAPIAIKRP